MREQILDHDHELFPITIEFIEATAVVTKSCMGESVYQGTSEQLDESFYSHHECELTESVQCHPVLRDSTGNTVDDDELLSTAVTRVERELGTLEITDPEHPQGTTQGMEMIDVEFLGPDCTISAYVTIDGTEYTVEYAPSNSARL